MATEPQIIDFYNNKDTSLSKMKKPDLYKKCQELIRENMKLQMINNVQQQEIEDMKNEEKQFEIIEDLTEKLGDEVQKNIDLEKDYEYQKSQHIKCAEKLEIMNFIDDFVDITFRREIDWFEPEVMERFCDDTLEHFPDNKELFLKCILCKYDIYEDKLYTYKELVKFCIECIEEDGGDFDIDPDEEEEIIDYVEGQTSYIYKCEIKEVKYYVLFE